MCISEIHNLHNLLHLKGPYREIKLEIFGKLFTCAGGLAVNPTISRENYEFMTLSVKCNNKSTSQAMLLAVSSHLPTSNVLSYLLSTVVHVGTSLKCPWLKRYRVTD